MMKSKVDEIRQRFDADVERFSNLSTGQSATIDAPLGMGLIAETAAAMATTIANNCQVCARRLTVGSAGRSSIRRGQLRI